MSFDRFALEVYSELLPPRQIEDATSRGRPIDQSQRQRGPDSRHDGEGPAFVVVPWTQSGVAERVAEGEDGVDRCLHHDRQCKSASGGSSDSRQSGRMEKARKGPVIQTNGVFKGAAAFCWENELGCRIRSANQAVCPYALCGFVH